MLAGFPFIIVWFLMNLTSSVGDYKIDLKKCVLSSVIMSITRVIGKWVFKCTHMCVLSACMSMGRVYTDWHNYLVSRYLSRMPLPDGLCLFTRDIKFWEVMNEYARESVYHEFDDKCHFLRYRSGLTRCRWIGRKC